MKRLIVAALMVATASPVLSAAESWEKSYQIIAEGKTLQSGVTISESKCANPKTNVGSYGGWAYCDKYVHFPNGLTSLVLHEEVMYKCYVGPQSSVNRNDTVRCTELPKTKN